MASRALYVEVASVLDRIRKLTEEGPNKPCGREAVEWIAADLASVLKSDNPRFDPVRFMQACGLKAA